ncbi:MAG TPA: serine/threonine-protein kinase, partial [Gemmataceae bacterium]
MEEKPAIDELLLRWEEALETDRPVSATELCRDRPELLGELQRRIALLQKVDGLLDLRRSTAELSGGPHPEPPAPWPTVPGHEILGEVDRGGMGVVYKARNPALDEVRAVKVMRVEALRTPARQERFLREMRVLARLKHPNIVPVHDARLLDGQPYFVMPLVEGGSLADHLDRFRGDPRRAARLIERVARGVDFAHSRGVYHRDLKPANILLGEGDTPLVSDFGLAGVFDAGGDEPGEGGGPAAPAGGTLAALRTTASGAVVGTLPYMSPEQVLGQAEQVGPRSDVWALGVILYELLTGERPFRGRGGEPLERRICSADPAPPSAKRPGLDRTLSAVVMRCLEKDPARRYPSAAALADDLAAWLDFRPVRGVREPWDRRLRRRARRLAPFAAVALGLGAVLALLVPVLAPD